MTCTVEDYRAQYTQEEYDALPKMAKKYLDAIERDGDLVDYDYVESLIAEGRALAEWDAEQQAEWYSAPRQAYEAAMLAAAHQAEFERRAKQDAEREAV